MAKEHVGFDPGACSRHVDARLTVGMTRGQPKCTEAAREGRAASDGTIKVNDYFPEAATRPARRPNDMAMEWLAPATVTG